MKRGQSADRIGKGGKVRFGKEGKVRSHWCWEVRCDRIRDGVRCDRVRRWGDVRSHGRQSEARSH